MIEESLNSLETNQQKIPETVQVSNKPHPVPVEVTQQLCEVHLFVVIIVKAML